MKKERFDTKKMVLLAMLCGLMLVLQITGIGLIPLPVIKATTMHIPVILGAVLLGWKGGAVLGAVFGLCSMWTNTTSPGLLSFAFSPVLAGELCGFGGALASLWTALGCRIALGIIAGLLWSLLDKWNVKDILALPVTAGIATVCHTLLVMGSIATLFAPEYAEAKGVALDAVFGLAMGVVVTSGIPEAIAAIVLVTAIGKALLSFAKR